MSQIDICNLEELKEFEKENFVVNSENEQLLVEISTADGKGRKIRKLTEEYFEFGDFHPGMEEKIFSKIKTESLTELDDEILHHDDNRPPNFHHRVIVYDFE